MSTRIVLSLPDRVLVGALLALAVLYAVWFGRQPAPWAELVIFALPPALLSVALLRRRNLHLTAFWAGVLALLWFCHGVMVAWSRPPARGFALVEVVLALAIVFAASLPGLRARFAKKRG